MLGNALEIGRCQVYFQAFFLLINAFQIPFEQEGAEIRQSKDIIFKTNVCVAKFDAIVNILIT
jgi:hypothetical protein